MTLGQKIQLSRKKTGMSQEDLGNVLNVSRQAVQKWESDVSIPELSKLVEISRMFDVSMDWLTKDTEFENEKVQEPMPRQFANEKEQVTGKGLFAVIKVFIWIGIFVSPLSLFASFYELLDEDALFFLFDFFITVPLGIWALYSLKKGATKRRFVLLGVLSIVFLSQIAGILMFTIPKNQTIPDQPKPVKKVEPIKEEVKLKAPSEEKVYEEPSFTKDGRNAKVLAFYLRVLASIFLIIVIIILFTCDLLIIHYSSFQSFSVKWDEAMFESNGEPNLAFTGLIMLIVSGVANLIFGFLKYKHKVYHSIVLVPLFSILMIMASIFILELDNFRIHEPFYSHFNNTGATIACSVLGIVAAALFLIAAFLDVICHFLYVEKKSLER